MRTQRVILAAYSFLKDLISVVTAWLGLKAVAKAWL
jgi:hypothetical protein